MKKLFTLLTLMMVVAGASAQPHEMAQTEEIDELVKADEPAPRSLFSNVGVSLNGGLTGLGATVSTPLSKNFTLRAGFGVLPYSYKYKTTASMDFSDQLAENGLGDLQINTTISHDIDLKAKLNVPAVHLLVDYNPFKDGFGAFHVTAGLFFGGSNMLHVTGDANLAQLQATIGGVRDQVDAQYPGGGDLLDIDVNDFMFDMGDDGVHLNNNGTADAYAKVNAVKPYLGVGWGNAIPKRRVGVRFDIGAMYQGKPRIESPNIDSKSRREIDSNKELNKILKYAKFYPQLSLQVTFRLLRDK